MSYSMAFERDVCIFTSQNFFRVVHRWFFNQTFLVGDFTDHDQEHTSQKFIPDFWIRFPPARTKSDRGVVTTDGGRTPRRGGQYAQNDDGATRV